MNELTATIGAMILLVLPAPPGNGPPGPVPDSPGTVTAVDAGETTTRIEISADSASSITSAPNSPSGTANRQTDEFVQAPTAFNPITQDRPAESTNAGADDQSATPCQPIQEAVFEQPCHFSFTGGGLNGSVAPRDHLVIYQGMTVRFCECKQIEVSCIAEVPVIPVVLRLQLDLWRTVEGGGVEHSGTIALPPVTLNPDGHFERHQPSRTMKIVLRRSSPLLRTDKFFGASDLALTRTGTARFGTIPERAEYSILPADGTSYGSR